MRFELILVASLMLLVSALPSKNDKCLTVNSQCNNNNGECCDGLKCEADNSPHKRSTCRSYWTTQPAAKGAEETNKIINAFVRSTFVDPSNACIASGANCAMNPNACCDGDTCVQDDFGSWSCM